MATQRAYRLARQQISANLCAWAATFCAFRRSGNELIYG
jgi:hypothetical protein